MAPVLKEETDGVGFVDQIGPKVRKPTDRIKKIAKDEVEIEPGGTATIEANANDAKGIPRIQSSDAAIHKTEDPDTEWGGAAECRSVKQGRRRT